MRTIGQRRVTEAFVSATEAAEMLSMSPPNVGKTLARYGVEHQTLTVGKRSMRVYLRDDVDRVIRTRQNKIKARARDILKERV